MTNNDKDNNKKRKYKTRKSGNATHPHEQCPPHIETPWSSANCGTWICPYHQVCPSSDEASTSQWCLQSTPALIEFDLVMQARLCLRSFCIDLPRPSDAGSVLCLENCTCRNRKPLHLRRRVSTAWTLETAAELLYRHQIAFASWNVRADHLAKTRVRQVWAAIRQLETSSRPYCCKITNGAMPASEIASETSNCETQCETKTMKHKIASLGQKGYKSRLSSDLTNG